MFERDAARWLLRIRSGRLLRLAENLWIGRDCSFSVPFGRAINPITGTNWEGTGVAPDIERPQAEALRVAHREAIAAILEELGADAPTALEWPHA